MASTDNPAPSPKHLEWMFQSPPDADNELADLPDRTSPQPTAL